MPIRFEPNLGQAPQSVRFLGRTASYDLLLRDNDAMLARSRGADRRGVRLRWPATGRAAATGAKRRGGVSNYLTGPDASQWKTNIPHYGEVLYADAFRGVDLLFYGSDQNIEFDLRVKPGAQTSAIEFFWDGCDSIALDSNGELILRTGREEIRQHKPVAYQQVAGRRQAVEAVYVLDGNRVRIEVGDYDRGEMLTIDPVLSYSTYTGYNGNDTGLAIGVDREGNAYIAGPTSSSDFPVTPGAFQSRTSGGDAGILKFNPNRNEIVYATYLGGTSSETAYGMVVDATGSVYLAGSTYSNNFPTTEGAVQKTFGGLQDCFVARVNSNGSGLIYSTYLGGTQYEYCNAIALDAEGNAYVAGMTNSQNFPTVAAVQDSNRGAYDVFVTKLNPQGASLVYSTYIGGSGNETALGIHVDAAGQAHFTGNSTSPNYPTLNPFQAELNGTQDVIVTKLSADGRAMLFSTYLGSGGADVAYAIRVHYDGTVYITGLARTADFPVTAGAFQTNFGGYFDAFVARLNAEGNALIFSTLLGGRLRENAFGIEVDSEGNAYICGFTTSPDYPRYDPVKDFMEGPREALHVTTDATATWAPSTAGMDVDNVLALSSTADGGELFASTWGYGVFKSMDGGGSWSPIGLETFNGTVGPLAVDPKNSSRIVAGTSLGIYRTEDGGAAWNVTSVNAGTVTSIVYNTADTNIVYASVTGRGVLKSTDGGALWTASNTGLTSTSVNALAMDPSNPQVLYAGTTSNIFKTIDGGRTWTQPMVPVFANITKLAVDSQIPEHVYAGTNGMGLMKSTNAGLTWSQGALYGKSISALAVHPSRPGTVFAAVNQEGVYRTYDGGITMVLFQPPPSKYVNSLWADPRQSDRVLAGSMTPSEGYVAKISADGASLLFSTYLGGVGSDTARAIALDAERKIYITGNTDGDGFPVTPNAIGPLGPGRANGFLSIISQ